MSRPELRVFLDIIFITIFNMFIYKQCNLRWEHYCHFFVHCFILINSLIHLAKVLGHKSLCGNNENLI